MASSSDNESVLSSLPSSPREPDEEEEEQLSGSEEDEDEDEEEEEEDEQPTSSKGKSSALTGSSSDAETEPLPLSSSVVRRAGGSAISSSARPRSTVEDDEDEDNDSEDEDGDEAASPRTTSKRAVDRTSKNHTPSSVASRKRRVESSPSSSSSQSQTGTSSHSRGRAAKGKGSKDTLGVPVSSSTSATTRRLSFDDGSDLSALTSEAEAELDNLDDDEEDEDDEEEDDDDEEEDSKANGTLRGKSGKSKLDDGDEDLDGTDNSDEDEDEDEDEDDEGLSNADDTDQNARSKARGRGRPPKRQNALAAAAKRQASKSKTGRSKNGGDGTHGKLDTDGQLLSGTEDNESEESEGDSDEPKSNKAKSGAILTKSPRRGKRAASEASMTSTSDGTPPLAKDTAEEESEEDITSEAERLQQPLPPFPDDSNDEDYVEPSSRPLSAKKKRHLKALQANGRRKRTSSNLRSALDGNEDGEDADLHTSDGGHDEDGGEEDDDKAQAADNSGDAHAAPTSDMDVDNKGEQSRSRGSESEMAQDDETLVDKTVITEEALRSLPGSLIAKPLAGMDIDDAMSGISDDVPILLQAANRATALVGPSALPPALNGTLPRLDTEDLSQAVDTGDEEPDTPRMLQPPSPRPVHRKSPGPTGRGRGRGGWGRGRGRKGQQSRLLEHDDREASASAAEDAHHDGDREGSHNLETPAASDHEEDPTDLDATKKRTEALEALTRIEIEFAKLRDRLFVERMEETARERWQIESGTHPEFKHLMRIIEHRRSARLELAKRVLDEAEDAQTRQTEASYRAIWYNWVEGRLALRQSMIAEANVKKRKLDREKRAIERPRSEDLASILRMHAPPPYMYYEKKSAATYGSQYSVEIEVAENLQKKRKRGAVGLDQDEALYDLERMGLRDPYRAVYPPHFAFDPAYAAVAFQGQPYAGGRVNPGLPHAYGYESHQQGIPAHMQHPLAANGRTVNSVGQYSAHNRADPFAIHRTTSNTQHVLGVNPSASSTNKNRPTLDDHLSGAVPAYSQWGNAGSSGDSRSGHARTNSRSQYDYANRPLPDAAPRYMPPHYAMAGQIN